MFGKFTSKSIALFLILTLGAVFPIVFNSSLVIEPNFISEVNAAEDGTTLYHGGNIITKIDDKPQYVEAVVKTDGKIVFAGPLAEAVEKFDGQPKKHNLDGQTLLLGFIDADGHIDNMGLVSLIGNILPPPNGPGSDFDGIIDATKAWMETDDGKTIINKLGWVIANGYDDTQLSEKEHPTSDVLDEISNEYPVLILHQSAHLGAVNNLGLKKLRLNRDTPKMKGGVIRRMDDGTPNGVLEEDAFLQALGVALRNANNLNP